MIKEVGKRNIKEYEILWDINRTCNNKCWYCINKSYEAENIELSIDELTKIIEYIKFAHSKLENLKVTILGGEPTVHPHIEYIINSLKDIKTIVTTNLKCSEHLIKSLNTFWDISLHYQWTDLNKFYNKLTLINKEKMYIKVLWDLNYKEEIIEVCKYLKAHKYYFSLIPLLNTHMKYTQTDLKIINEYNYAKKINDNSYWYYLENNKEVIVNTMHDLPVKNFKGYLCEAGEKHHSISIDGYVYKCKDHEEKNINILESNFDDIFNKITKKRLCTFNECFCHATDIKKKII